MSPLNSQPARLLLGRSSRCPLAPRRRYSRQFWNTALICLGLQLSFVLPAAGQSQTDELARRHFESGASYLEQSDYESALREFKKSYELSERPEILLNLALVHERTGDWEHAISAINKFIAAAPESERIGTLKLRRDNLQKRLDEQRAAEAMTAPAPAETEEKTSPEPPPPPAAAADEPDRPWAYVSVSLGGVAARGSLITGLVAASEYSSAEGACSPTCTDDEVSTGTRMATTSTVLTVVAVAGGALGAYFWFYSSPEVTADAASYTPDWGVKFSPHQASTQARWSF